MANQNNQQQQPRPNPNRGKRPWWSRFIYLVYIVIMLALIYGLFGGGGSPSKQSITWERLEPILEKHHYESITVINQEYAEIRIKRDEVNRDTITYRDIITRTMTGDRGQQGYYVYNIGNYEHFDKELSIVEAKTGEHISYTIETRSNAWRELLVWFGPLLMLIFFFWIFGAMTRRQMGGDSGGGFGGMFGFGRSTAKQYDATKQNNVSFKDVAGLAGAKEEVMEVVDFLKNPKRYTDLGGKIPKGVLLVGPPGTGKTLLAKAVAGEAGVPFFSMSGSDFVEMFVGVGASRVRDLFQQAKSKSPCIIFIDEIDAVGRARSKNPAMGGNDERENTLNALLTEMDGFGTNSGVIILAATNRADMLDSALLRAGRFDRQIHVDLPDLNERKEVFIVHLKPLKIDDTVDIDFLARQTPGFSGADIANVCNEAALIAARHNSEKVGKQDFLDAVDRIIGGLEKKTKVMTQAEKRSIAIHEAGHATISWFTEFANPLVKVSIVPRGQALGAAWYLPEERVLQTKEAMLDEMCSLLGGRAAEELFIGSVSTGAMNDLERTTKQAYGMIAFAGMSDKLPNICYYNNAEYQFQKPYSETTAKIMDDEVLRMINEQYERAKRILTEHKEGHAQLAQLLIDREVIFAEDVEKVFGKRPWTSRAEELLEAQMKADAERMAEERAKELAASASAEADAETE